jgi:DNA-binding XRE family transcriptional regulator
MMVKQPLKDGVEIGRRIRRQRINKGMRQTELATSCGITFQQIQKYEKGMNRVGGSRMIKRGTKSNPIEGELWVSHDRRKRGGRRDPSQGHAGDLDDRD